MDNSTSVTPFYDQTAARVTLGNTAADTEMTGADMQEVILRAGSGVAHDLIRYAPREMRAVLLQYALWIESGSGAGNGDAGKSAQILARGAQS